MKISDVKIISEISKEQQCAKIVVEDMVVEFYVQYIKEDDREWLMGVLKDRFAEVYAGGYNKALSDVKSARNSYLKALEG